MESWQERVKTLRENLGLTQLQLAIELGVTPATIHLWEGREKPPLSHEAFRFMEFERAHLLETAGG
jgi:DNA-binding transcriptional regulator YiaG